MGSDLAQAYKDIGVFWQFMQGLHCVAIPPCDLCNGFGKEGFGDIAWQGSGVMGLSEGELDCFGQTHVVYFKHTQADSWVTAGCAHALASYLWPLAN
jgi:hypothetical protein